MSRIAFATGGVIAVVASLTANAQTPESSVASGSLASSTWFVDGTPTVADDEDREEFDPLELTFTFDAAQRVTVSGLTKSIAKIATPAAKQQDGAGFEFTCECPKSGRIVCSFRVVANQLDGELVWRIGDGEVREYDLVARRATEFDGTEWRVKFAEVALDEDGEAAAPFEQSVRFHRGLLCLVAPNDDEGSEDAPALVYEPVRYDVVTSKAAGTKIRTGPPAQNVDGIQWSLTVQGDSLVGSLTEEYDGEMAAKYDVRGTRVAVAEAKASK